jgi:phosphatidylserine decarboxylase
MSIFLAVVALISTLFLFWRFWFFMRNPKRKIPDGDDFLAPADGYVVYVKRVEAGQVPIAIKRRQQITLEELSREPALMKSSGYLMGIFMTAFSVHHNRIPLAGKVSGKYHAHPAQNMSTARLMTNILIGRKPYEEDCTHVLENERITIVIQTPSGAYTLTQIADKWISHIINPAEPGDMLERGAVYGMIRFGSQVDVFIPDDLGYTPVRSPGDYVYAGESILAKRNQFNTTYGA